MSWSAPTQRIMHSVLNGMRSGMLCQRQQAGSWQHPQGARSTPQARVKQAHVHTHAHAHMHTRASQLTIIIFLLLPLPLHVSIVILIHIVILIQLILILVVSMQPHHLRILTITILAVIGRSTALLRCWPRLLVLCLHGRGGGKALRCDFLLGCSAGLCTRKAAVGGLRDWLFPAGLARSSPRSGGCSCRRRRRRCRRTTLLLRRLARGGGRPCRLGTAASCAGARVHPWPQELLDLGHGGEGLYEDDVGAVVAHAGVVSGAHEANLEGVAQRLEPGGKAAAGSAQLPCNTRKRAR
jgi:hypothetical protein